MIDVDLMLEEAEKQKAMHFVMAAGFTNSEIIFMLTRLREAEKDAARYRWLRDIASHEYDVDDFFGGSSDSVDGMIDKAMKEKGDEQDFPKLTPAQEGCQRHGGNQAASGCAEIHREAARAGRFD